MSWNAFLKEKIKQRQYLYRKRTKKDVLCALNAYKGLGVNECIYQGKCIMESGTTLLSLTGTISVKSQEKTASNVSVRVILPKRYPDQPPVVHIIPTIEANFASNRYIDDKGRIHSPVLRNWQNTTECDIVYVIEQMRHIFGQQCINCDEPSGTRLSVASNHVLRWDAFLERILAQSNQYRYKDDVKNDVLAVLDRYPTLKPTYEDFTAENSSGHFLLCLRGTIPANLSDTMYQIPVEIWIHPRHPRQAPIVNVKRTSNLNLNPTSYADCNGRITLPELSNWKNTSGRRLVFLVDKLRIAFERESPVYSENRSFDKIPHIVTGNNVPDFEDAPINSNVFADMPSLTQNTNRLYPDLQSEFRAKVNNRKISPDSDYYMPPCYGNSDYEFKEQTAPSCPVKSQNKQQSGNSVEFHNLDRDAIQMTLTMQMPRNDLVAALN